ncbi:hypothetical protein LWF15_27160 [Kineosporia rhizophila]|uniref:hypothetical protein n=1 Tax=Kineosporia TaxID=49184 RepID=UPI001E6102CF|nr:MULTISPECIES: hypothetical protein [Kineosporia]MCE0539186.1 hypothetical protein [Kineosporia rhizophila]GLY18050.1 hypothetical protein Kisp01_50640 [Kineosporia sp. NBRC 101677]
MRLVPRLPRLIKLPQRVTMPPETEKALGLDQPRQPRLLAWSVLVGGGAAAATVRDLRIVTPRGERIVRSWSEVDHAVWDQDSAMLVIWWVGTRKTTPLEIQDDIGRLPEVVRERVQSSVVLTASVPMPRGKPARVALRRDPEGRLVAQSLLPPGLKADAPDVKPVIDQALADLWAEAGEQGLNAGAPPVL